MLVSKGVRGGGQEGWCRTLVIVSQQTDPELLNFAVTCGPKRLELGASDLARHNKR
jgi:hypothetical protein